MFLRKFKPYFIYSNTYTNVAAYCINESPIGINMLITLAHDIPYLCGRECSILNNVLYKSIDIHFIIELHLYISVLWVPILSALKEILQHTEICM